MKNPLAKKKFGQHFLVNQGILEKIVMAVESQAKDNKRVLEIGPGPGALTEALLKRGFEVHAIEIDKDLIPLLEKRFSNQKFQVHNVDILEWSPDEDFLKNPPSVVVGNLPYNIGNAIVFRFLESYPWAKSFIFMLQKEVVERLKATTHESSDYGIPSVKLSWLCEVDQYFWVKPGSFSPPPKVDSGVICYHRKQNPEIHPIDKSYAKVSSGLEKLFQARRKMLRATLPQLKELPLGEKRVQELTPIEILELLK